MRHYKAFRVILALCVLLGGAAVVASKPAERSIRRVALAPNLPEPFEMRNWREVALGYDRLAFDLDAVGEHLPLIWLERDEAGRTIGFGMGSYVGDYRRMYGDRGPRAHEAITTLGSLLGATLVGVDKSEGPVNWVALATQYQTPEGLVLNKPVDRSGVSFWYETFPLILLYSLAERYPAETELGRVSDEAAARWREAAEVMTDAGRALDFNHTAFDFRAMRPVDNGRWREPGAAGAIGWIEYVAYRRARASGDPDAERFLEAATWCMNFLDRWPTNPYYEVQLLFGALTAARMNAELDRDYDLDKIINWCFERSVARPDMIMIAERWAGHDVHGLYGSRREDERGGGGYAFAMNTFVTAWPIVPIARYDDRYARSIGKWMRNAANAARLFYPGAHPPDRQSSPGWTGDPENVVAYEGVRHGWHADRPHERLYAAGDPLVYDWGPIETDLGLYGSAYAGVFGAIIERTEHEAILRLDLLATDFYRDPAYPTWLYFNPYAREQTVAVDVGDQPRDLYEAVSNRFVARGAVGPVNVTLPPDCAVVLVVAPANGRVERDGARLLIDGVVVDYLAR